MNPDGVGRRQHFESGGIYWKLNEAYAVHGAFGYGRQGPADHKVRGALSLRAASGYASAAATWSRHPTDTT